MITKKELKRFGITNCMKCVMYNENASIENAFFECGQSKKLCDESLQRFNNFHNTNVSLTSLQIFLNREKLRKLLHANLYIHVYYSP